MTASNPVAVFSALADDTRWEILGRLGTCPASASTLARQMPVSRQAITRHLDVLRSVGLVASERRGRQIVHFPLGHRLDELAEELERIGAQWERQLGLVRRLAENDR